MIKKLTWVGESIEMEKQKQYREDLLEWCNTAELNWNRLKPSFSKVFDTDSLEEWEESCRQLKEKLQADIKADYDDYETANGLYDQLEQLYRESNSYQEEIDVESDNVLKMDDELQMDEDNFEEDTDQTEMDVDSDLRLEIEDQIQIDEADLETDAFEEGMEVETEQSIETEEQKQYRENLLEWCNNLYSNWNSMKPRFSKMVDTESLEGWEGLCTHLQERLQKDLTADQEEFEIANRLYEQWEKLLRESDDYQEELEV